MQGRYDIVCPVSPPLEWSQAVKYRDLARAVSAHLLGVLTGKRECADTQMRAAFDLKKAWGDSLELIVVPDAGHSGNEPGTAKALKEVGTRGWRQLKPVARV